MQMLITQRVVIDVSEKVLKHLQDNPEEAAEQLSNMNLDMHTVVSKYDPTLSVLAEKSPCLSSQDEWSDEDFGLEDEDEDDGPDND